MYYVQMRYTRWCGSRVWKKFLVRAEHGDDANNKVMEANFSFLKDEDATNIVLEYTPMMDVVEV